MSEQAQHTPGPWEVKAHDMGSFVYCPMGYLISGPINDRPDGKDNGTLIAAAPDLLSALELFKEAEKSRKLGDWQAMHLDLSEAFEAMNAAIAKARGQA